MNKREYCESRESIAYYSGLNGLEIKGIEYGIDDFAYCVSGCWYGGKAAQRSDHQRCRPGKGKSKRYQIQPFSVTPVFHCHKAGNKQVKHQKKNSERRE